MAAKIENRNHPKNDIIPIKYIINVTYICKTSCLLVIFLSYVEDKGKLEL
tara:strand:+ start:305 stop:454 length:150 start_codon:yes stop_codon:yes gene_type:complete